MTSKWAPEDTPQNVINISNVQMGGGIVGFVVSAAIVFIFLAGIPALRWFPVGAILLGSLIAVALHFYHKRKPGKGWNRESQNAGNKC